MCQFTTCNLKSFYFKLEIFSYFSFQKEKYKLFTKYEQILIQVMWLTTQGGMAWDLQEKSVRNVPKKCSIVCLEDLYH